MRGGDRRPRCDAAGRRGAACLGNGQGHDDLGVKEGSQVSVGAVGRHFHFHVIVAAFPDAADCVAPFFGRPWPLRLVPWLLLLTVVEVVRCRRCC
jgi:hypothetical protein